MKKIFSFLISFFITILFADEPNLYKGEKSYTILNAYEVKDNLTGLIWQRAYGSKRSWDDAKKYCQNLQLAGHDNWRLPHSQELFYIVDFNSKKMIDTNYFKDKNRIFWASNQHLTRTTYGWSVDFRNGMLDWNYKPNLFYSRCVRDDEKIEFHEENRFEREGDVLYDKLTKLYWQDDKAAKETIGNFTEAKEYCSNLELDGYTDWRVPEIYELVSILNYDRVNPYTFKDFKNIQSDWYWANQMTKHEEGSAWLMEFNLGIPNWDRAEHRRFIRCLR